MSKTWLTADWHLGDDRLEILGRPFVSPQEQLCVLAHNHNLVVKPEDTVIIVGDVCYQKTPEWLKYVGTHFNGKKILVRGNHDRVFTDEQLRPYFEMIVPDGGGFYQTCGGLQCYITHYPTQGVEDVFNVVGHIHGAWKYQLNMLNVGVDANHYRPVDADAVPRNFKAICEFYDEDVWVGYNRLNLNEHTANRGKKSTYFNPSAPSARANLFVTKA